MARRKSVQPTLLVFVGGDYEDLELWYPRLRLIEAGYGVLLVGDARHVVYHGKHGYPARSDAAFGSVDVRDHAGVVIPGGWMPDQLRRNARVLELVRAFDQEQKLIAAICHGGWIPISAGVYRGVRVTGSVGIKDDLINAGALYEDAPVVVDRHFVSSRRPDDLPEFMRAVLEHLGR